MEAELLKLMMEHRMTLHSFVYALVRDPHETEDILQEVSVVLWKKFSEFTPGTDFGAWARAVAYREVLSARRREWRARRFMDDACAQELLAAYERRVESVDATSHREALRRCIEGLGDQLRQIVSWRYTERLSSQEVARRLSKTAQAVDALVYRAKKALADCVRARLAES